MPVVGWDQQIAGVRDNGTEHGVVSMEIKRGNLVVVPFRLGLAYTQATGAGVGVAFAYPFTNNDNGYVGGINVAVPASASLGKYGYVCHHFKGGTYGLHYDRISSGSATCDPFGVVIDGVPYAPNYKPLLHPVTQAKSASSGGLMYDIYATDIPERPDGGPHFVELFFPCAASGATRAYLLYGFVADAAAGYQSLGRFCKLGMNPVSLTANTPASVTSSVVASSYGFRKLWITNPTAGAAIVTLYYTGKSVFWRKSIAAGDTVEFDPGLPHPFNYALYINSDTTGVIVSASEVQ